MNQLDNAARLCYECGTDDCFHPNQTGCQACQEARVSFMNTPLYYLESEAPEYHVEHAVGVSPTDIFQWVVQPWKALLNLLLLN